MHDITSRLLHAASGGPQLKEGDKVSTLYLVAYDAKPSHHLLDMIAKRENTGDYQAAIDVKPFPFSQETAQGMAHQNMGAAEAYYLVAITTQVPGWARGSPHKGLGMPRDQWMDILSENADALMAKFYGASQKAPSSMRGLGYCRLDPSSVQGNGNPHAH